MKRMSFLLLHAVLLMCWQQYMIHAEIQNVSVVNGTNETDNVPYVVNGTQGAGQDVLLSKEVSHDLFIGFTAWAQASQSLNDGDLVVFDGVNINEGGFYDVNTNTFTCPFDGIYFVSVTIRGIGSSVSAVYVMKESQIVMNMYSDANTPDNICTHSLTVRCIAGERIWVESTFDGAQVYGEAGVPHTTFTIMVMNLQSRKLLHNTFEGFTVYGVTYNYNNGDVIDLGDVLLNEGDHYKPDLNLFVCPVSGIYYVMTTFYKATAPHMLGVEKAPYIILHSENGNPWNILSNNRLLYCLQGEQIYIRAAVDGRIYGIPYTTFSVMLLQEQAPYGQAHSLFIGFSAWKRLDQTYSSGDVIVFDGIMINEGNAYNTDTNRFECPVPGIYYVSVNFKKVGSNAIHLGVEYQSTSILRSEEISGGNSENVVSNSCIVRCYPGEEIKVVAAGSGSVRGDISKYHTTFTIFLMYQS